jgi:hypothetical protein
MKIPLARLNEVIKTIGIDAHQFHDHFSPTSAETPYPIIHGGGEEIRRRMLIEHNQYAHPKTDKAKQLFEEYSSRVLVPDRIWWDTAHVIALYSEKPLLSNIFYAIWLKVEDCVREQAEKALVLWLNTTWGLLTVLVSREETRGRWTRLKMAQWRMLQVLDVRSLGADALKRLSEVFDRCCKRAPRRIPDQFDPRDPDPVRLEIDKGFVKALNPSINEKALEESLMELYKRLNIAFRRWIVGTSKIEAHQMPRQ